MTKKTLDEKIKVIIWLTLLFILFYFSFAAWLRSDGEIFNPELTYELIKDTLTITAAFLAPLAAFILFSDWKEQHNKQISNDFILKLFTQFEVFEESIEKASLILIELENLIPEGYLEAQSGNYRPLYLKDPIFKENHELILSFTKKLQRVQEDFRILMDKCRTYSIVVNQIADMELNISIFINQFEKIYDDEDDSYGEYREMLETYSKKLNKFIELRTTIYDFVIYDVLKKLQAK